MSTELELLKLKRKKLQLQMQMDQGNAQQNDDSNFMQGVQDVADMIGASPQAGMERGQQGLAAISGINKGLVDVANLPFMASGFLADQANSLMGRETGNNFDLYDIPFIQQATAKPQVAGVDADVGDSIYAGAQWASGLPSAAAKGLSKIPDLMMGLGAGVGEELGGETGEMMGGMLALAQSLRTGKPADLDKVSQQASEFIQANTLNPDRALTDLGGAIARNEQGTLADLSNDAGLYNLEGAVPKGTNLDRAINEQIIARQEQSANEIAAPFGEGSAELARSIAAGDVRATNVNIADVAKQQRNTLEQTVSKQISEAEQVAAQQQKLAEQATAEADQLAAGVSTTTKEFEGSRALRGAVEKNADELRKSLLQPAWDKFEKGAPVEISELQNVLSEKIDSLAPELADDLVSKYKTLIGQIENWEGQAEPRSVQYVLSQIKDATNNAKQTGNYTVLEKELGRLGEAIQKQLENPVNNTAFTEALSASKEFYRKTGKNTKFGKAVLNEEAETFADRVSFQGNKGAATGRIIQESGSEEIKSLAQDQIKAIAVNEGIDQKFMDNYDGFLSEFPELKRDFQRVADSRFKAAEMDKLAKEVATKSEAGSTKLKSTLEKEKGKISNREAGLAKSISREIISKYNDAPEATVTNLLKSKDGAKELNKLYRGLKMAGGEAEFKAQIGQQMRDILAPKVNKTNRADAGSIDKFDKMRKTLVDSKVLTKKEADDIAEALQRNDTEFLRRSAGNQSVKAVLSETDKLMASAGAATLLAPASGGAQLMLQASVRRQLVNYMQRKKYSDKTLAKIDEFIANPERYYDAAMKLSEKQKGKNSPEKVARNLVSTIFATGQIAAEE
jgi:hypothetical protein